MDQSAHAVCEKYVHLLRLDQPGHLTVPVGRMPHRLPDAIRLGPVIRRPGLDWNAYA